MADELNTSYGLQVEIGMLLEVLNIDNEVLFRARVTEFDGDSMKIVNDLGGEMPPVLYNTEFKLRGHLSDSQTAVYHGTVCGSTRDMWKLDQISNWFTWERREFFRQNISVPAMVMRLRSVHDREGDTPLRGKKVKCKLLDVSGGGVLMACDENYERGDEVRVSEAVIVPGGEPFSFRCRIRRVEEARYSNLYGCQFLELQEGEQDRLIRAIFLLQREEAKRLRGK